MQQLVDDVFWKIELLERKDPGYGIAPMAEWQPTARLFVEMPWEDFAALFIEFNDTLSWSWHVRYIHEHLKQRNSKFELMSYTTYPDRNGFGTVEFLHYGNIDTSSIEADVRKLVDDLYACKIEDTLNGK